ncbi:alpha/beta hydrolase fold domain-containing protein [Sphingomonas sp.]|uniref:alpha/beta hydrolase fold domain-containing protein n=1 Tax=Sphingomonas sp. TaxID=28214 RepID=UPI003F7FDBD7
MVDAVRFAPWVSDEAAATFRAEAATPPAPAGDIAALRVHYDAFNRRHLDTALAAYSVDVAEEEIAGVKVYRVEPREPANEQRLLLCLHGGAFMWGAGAGALLEAVPVAATARTRVIAIDYELAPEHIFPAAVNDVLAVYRAVLERLPAASIGVYGCSAGGALTAQSVARMVADGVALPGAIAMLHGTGLELGGDSLSTAPALLGMPDQAGTSFRTMSAYFTGVDAGDPLAFPGEHPDMLAKFPPSLLVTGTRDFFASSVTVMHRRLLAAGVEAQLLYFEGMWHAHHMATTMPEARETFAALARFFDRYLA